MTVANMGSTGRMNYTLMGDNVNLGARLEGTNKEYYTTIIISEYTYAQVKDKVIARELDNIRVKGKNKPVLIYELLDVIDGLEPPAKDGREGEGAGGSPSIGIRDMQGPEINPAARGYPRWKRAAACPTSTTSRRRHPGTIAQAARDYAFSTSQIPTIRRT